MIYENVYKYETAYEVVSEKMKKDEIFRKTTPKRYKFFGVNKKVPANFKFKK